MSCPNHSTSTTISGRRSCSTCSPTRSSSRSTARSRSACIGVRGTPSCRSRTRASAWRRTSYRACSSVFIASRARERARTRARALAWRWCTSWCACTAARSRCAARSTGARPSRSRFQQEKRTSPRRASRPSASLRPARRTPHSSKKRCAGRPVAPRVCRAARTKAASSVHASWSSTTTPTCVTTSRAYSVRTGPCRPCPMVWKRWKPCNGWLRI